MLDTEVGTQEKDDPADVAKVGFEVMQKGEGDVITGWKNKAQVAMSSVTPVGTKAEIFRKYNEPGTGLASPARFPTLVRPWP